MIKNVKSKPEVYYGLHMVEGLAEYADPGVEPYRIYIGETTIKNMNPSFQGKPVYVEHVDEVDESDLERDQELDGVVVRSFFNKSDGKNWAEFVVFTEAAKTAIKMGWKLSNAYVPTQFSGGGENHGASYVKEVTGGEYEHLAIVQHPRYEESIILTPEQFKAYNGEKEIELTRLANSKNKKENGKMGTLAKLNIFKRTKVENSIDLNGLMVELPKSKKEMLLTDVVTKFDAIQNMNGYANGDHMVKVGEDEMSVNDLVTKHMEMCNAAAEKEAAEAMDNAGEGEPGVDIENDSEEETIEEGAKDIGDRGGDESFENEEEEEKEEKEKSKKNSASTALANAKAKALKLKNAKAKALALKNAGPGRDEEEVARVDMAEDQVARGKARYGS